MIKNSSPYDKPTMPNEKMNNQPVLDKTYKLANTPSTNGWPHHCHHFMIWNSIE